MRFISFMQALTQICLACGSLLKVYWLILLLRWLPAHRCREVIHLFFDFLLRFGVANFPLKRWSFFGTGHFLIIKVALESFLLCILLELFNEAFIGVDLNHETCTLLRFLCSIVIISPREHLNFFSKYAITIVTLLLIPAMQWTSTFVCFLACSMKSKVSLKNL